MGSTATRSSDNVRMARVLLLATPFLALLNLGFPIGSVRLRLTEIVVALIWLTLIHSLSRPDDDVTFPRRSAAPLWLAGGGYLIVASIAGGVAGLGALRFEVEALALFAATLAIGSRLTDRRLAGVASFAILAACVAAVVLAAFGVRALWFFGPDGAMQVIRFGQGGADTSGLLQLGGTLGHKSYLAAFLVLSLPVALGRLLDRGSSTVDRRLAMAALAAGVVTLALTEALIGAACGVGVLAVMSIRLLPSRSGRVVAFSLLGAGCVALVAILFATGRLEALTGEGGLGPLRARLYLWDEGLRLVMGRPWFGVGRGAFGELVAGGFPHAHCLYLMKLIETGVIGGFLFAALITIVAASALRGFLSSRISLTRVGFCAGTIGFALYASADYFYNEPPLMILFWLWAGIAVGRRGENAGAGDDAGLDSAAGRGGGQ